MSKERFLIAVFAGEVAAERAVRAAIEADFPMDRISVLGKLGASGDDVLGILHPGIGERAKVWAGQGAAWGGLLGLLAGAFGLFVFPGLGAVAIAGPLVEAVVGALSGAALGGGALAGAAAVSQLGVALHRHGIDESSLSHFHELIAEGRYVVMLQSTRADLEKWSVQLKWAGAQEVEIVPSLRNG